MIPTVSQDKLLANDANKNRLIGMLKIEFEPDSFMVNQAMEVADALMINMAITISCTFDSIIVVLFF